MPPFPPPQIKHGESQNIKHGIPQPVSQTGPGGPIWIVITGGIPDVDSVFVLEEGVVVGNDTEYGDGGGVIVINIGITPDCWEELGYSVIVNGGGKILVVR